MIQVKFELQIIHLFYAILLAGINQVIRIFLVGVTFCHKNIHAIACESYTSAFMDLALVHF